MLETLPMLIEHLQKTFSDRCRRNPQYSLRSFARSLSMDSSTLSALLRKKRPLTAKTAQKLISALEIKDPAQAQTLLLGALNSRSSGNDLPYRELDLDVAETISSWEHFAILAFLELDTKRCDTNAIAQRLGIPLGIVVECAARLVRLGLIQRLGDTWVLTGKNMATPSNVPSFHLREALRQNMQKAMDSLEEDPVHRRDMSGITMAISSERLPEARKLIQDFRRKLAAFLEEGSKRDAVYRLNVELFPLTREEIQ